MKEHRYTSKLEWTGNKGSGTDAYKSYERSHNIIFENRPVIHGSSDPSFRGDKTKHSPEDLFVSTLSSCHMLWYLHFCSINNVIVEEYTDIAEGVMLEDKSGKGHFTEVVLNPNVIVRSKEMVAKAIELHEKANEFCFIANSVKFPVKHRPKVSARSDKSESKPGA